MNKYEDVFKFLTIDLINNEDTKKRFIDRFMNGLVLDPNWTRSYYYLSIWGLFEDAKNGNWDVVLSGNTQGTYNSERGDWKNYDNYLFIKILPKIGSVSETIKELLKLEGKKPEAATGAVTQYAVICLEDGENFKNLKNVFSNYGYAFSVWNFKEIIKATLG